MEGHIFNIQRFSLHDGPGIRTVVFLKGCNLRCRWCHNPESFTAEVQIRYDPSLCVGCGKCTLLCKSRAHYYDGKKRFYDRSRCTLCGACTEYCPAEALVKVGRSMCPSEVIDEIMKDCDYYFESGGGVTFSGGEPLLQRDFLKELLIDCKSKGINTAVESALNVRYEIIESIIDYTDLFLIDIKCIDENTHLRETGVDNMQILKNAKMLSASAKKLWIRIPVIPGVNDTLTGMTEILSFVKTLDNVDIVELMPFHNMGGKKYDTLGMNYDFHDAKPPNVNFLDKVSELFLSEGITFANRQR